MVGFVATHWNSYLVGFALALFISIVGILGSIIIGTIVALGRRSNFPIVRAAAGAYVAVFRGIPPLLSLYLVYFGIPSWAYAADIVIIKELLSPLNNRVVAAIASFMLTSGAYSAEIIRAAISSVQDEQREAAKSIGMSRSLAFRRVIAPQAFRIAFPPLTNEYIALLKATSLASVIGVTELMRTAQIAANLTFNHLAAYSMAGLYYVVFVLSLQGVFQRVERILRVGRI